MRYGEFFVVAVLALTACQDTDSMDAKSDMVVIGNQVDMGENTPDLLSLEPLMVYEGTLTGPVIKNGSLPEGRRIMGSIPLELGSIAKVVPIVLQNNAGVDMHIFNPASTNDHYLVLYKPGGGSFDYTIASGREQMGAVFFVDEATSSSGPKQATLSFNYQFTGGEQKTFTFDVQGEVVANQVVYVAPTGDDTADGLTPTTPKHTIQAAITAVETKYAGYSIIVTPGEYPEQLFIGSSVQMYGKGDNTHLVLIHPPAVLKSNPPGSGTQDIVAIAGSGVQVKLLYGLNVTGQNPVGCGASSTLGVYEGAELEGLTFGGVVDQTNCTTGVGLTVGSASNPATARLFGGEVQGHNIGVDVQTGSKAELSMFDFGADVKTGQLPGFTGLRVGAQAQVTVQYGGAYHIPGTSAQPAAIIRMLGKNAHVSVIRSDFNSGMNDVLVEALPGASGSMRWMGNSSRSIAGFQFKGSVSGVIQGSYLLTTDPAAAFAAGDWIFRENDVSFDGVAGPFGKGITVTGTAKLTITGSNFLEQDVALSCEQMVVPAQNNYWGHVTGPQGGGVNGQGARIFCPAAVVNPFSPAQLTTHAGIYDY